MSSISFWLAIIFIQSGIVYLIYEVMLGEKLLTSFDTEFKFMQLWAWTGFLLGFAGYSQVFLHTLEQLAQHNK